MRSRKAHQARGFCLGPKETIRNTQIEHSKTSILNILGVQKGVLKNEAPYTLYVQGAVFLIPLRHGSRQTRLHPERRTDAYSNSPRLISYSPSM